MYKNFNLTDEERQQIMEQHKSHGYKKPLNEKMFNDEGEPMMSYRQYQDSNKPLEPDYEDMYNDEEEGEDMYNNDDEYYFDAPIGRRLHDGTMIKFRDDNGDEFGGEILKMVHYEDDEPKYEILPNGDRYSTYRYPHEIKIDRSYSPKYYNENRKPLNELNPQQFKAEGVVDGNKRMSFPVTEMSYVDGDVNMNMIDPISKEKLYVVNFRGPIYNAKNTVTKYRNVNFTNINIKNYSQIAKQFGIPFMTT